MNTELITSKIADLANDILETKLELVRVQLMTELRNSVIHDVEDILDDDAIRSIMSAQTPSGLEGKVYNAFNKYLADKYANSDIDLHEAQEILTTFRGVERQITRAIQDDNLLRLPLYEK
jgi:hypothetical protein